MGRIGKCDDVWDHVSIGSFVLVNIENYNKVPVVGKFWVKLKMNLQFTTGKVHGTRNGSLGFKMNILGQTFSREAVFTWQHLPSMRRGNFMLTQKDKSSNS